MPAKSPQTNSRMSGPEFRALMIELEHNETSLAEALNISRHTVRSAFVMDRVPTIYYLAISALRFEKEKGSAKRALKELTK